MARCGNSKEEMKLCSPMSYVENIAKANLKIFHGKGDDVVSFMHSKRLFDAVNERYPRARIYLDIFDGGHVIDMQVATYWIMSQYSPENNTAITE